MTNSKYLTVITQAIGYLTKGQHTLANELLSCHFPGSETYCNREPESLLQSLRLYQKAITERGFTYRNNEHLQTPVMSERSEDILDVLRQMGRPMMISQLGDFLGEKPGNLRRALNLMVAIGRIQHKSPYFYLEGEDKNGL